MYWLSRLVVAFLLASLAQLTIANSAFSFTRIYSFPGTGAFLPKSALLMDSAGNLYGTSTTDPTGKGVVFELSPTSGNNPYTYRTLYTFCQSSNCSDGYDPIGGLIMDTSCNLYGTASSGGTGSGTGGGAVFELSPSSCGGGPTVTWAYNKIHSFAAPNDPEAALSYAGQSSGSLYDGVSNLYGTTVQGGSASLGTIYSLSNSSGWVYTKLYTFCSTGIPCPHGNYPYAGVVVDGSGNLYGTTIQGGVGDEGVVYELNTTGMQSVLHSFCPGGANPCTDGKAPFAGLTLDTTTNDLYGTTQQGGPGTGNGAGVIFKLSGCPSSCTETVLYSFCPAAGCADGLGPSDGLGPVLDASGNLFGTTSSGGANSQGTVYEIPSGSTEVVLKNFCHQTGCSDGRAPIGGLIRNSAGTYFGVTSNGGDSDIGTAYKLTPP